MPADPSITTFSLAIVGCGLTGTAMLWHLVKKLCDKRAEGLAPRRPIRIAVFDRKKNPGPGLPYDRDLIFPFHITNMEAGDMSIDADDPEDFSRWVSEREAYLKTAFPELDQWFSQEDELGLRKRFLPRMVMGEYLRERLAEALKRAEQNDITIALKARHQVLDIRDEGAHLSLSVMNEASLEMDIVKADKVLLATGHWFKDQGPEGFFPSPWPAGRIASQIPPGEDTAVIGTSLSAIDTALTLLSDGAFEKGKTGTLKFMPGPHSRRVALFSRRGLLPKVRGRTGTYQNRFYTKEAVEQMIARETARGKQGLILADVFGLLDRELEFAYGKPMDWQSVMNPSGGPIIGLREDIRLARQGDTPAGDILWQTVLFQGLPVKKTAFLNLAPEQRSRFETEFKSVFMVHAAPIPLINAEKILALLESGVCTINRLNRPFHPANAPKSGGFEFDFTDPNGKAIRRIFPFVVDARGQSLSYKDNPSPLAKNLLTSGLARCHGKGIDIDPDRFRVRTNDKNQGATALPKIFAVGVMNQGQVINVSMARECALSTHTVACEILRDLYGLP